MLSVAQSNFVTMGATSHWCVHRRMCDIRGTDVWLHCYLTTVPLLCTCSHARRMQVTAYMEPRPSLPVLNGEHTRITVLLCRTLLPCLGPNRLLGVQLIALYVLISLAYYFK